MIHIVKQFCRVVATLLVTAIAVAGTAGVASADPVDDLIAELPEDVQQQIADAEKLSEYVLEAEPGTDVIGLAVSDDPDIIPVGTLDVSSVDEDVSAEVLDSFAVGHLLAGGSVYGRFDDVYHLPTKVYDRIRQKQDEGWTGTVPLDHVDEFVDEDDPFDIPRWNMCLKDPGNSDRECGVDNTLGIPTWYEQSLDEILNCGGVTGALSAEDAATRFVNQGREDLASQILEGSVVIDLGNCSSEFVLDFLRSPDFDSVAGFSASILQSIKSGQGSAASIALFSLKLLPMDVDNVCPSLEDGVTMFIKPSQDGSDFSVSCVAQPSVP